MKNRPIENRGAELASCVTNAVYQLNDTFRPPKSHREIHDFVASELKLQLDRHMLIDKIVSEAMKSAPKIGTNGYCAVISKTVR